MVYGEDYKFHDNEDKFHDNEFKIELVKQQEWERKIGHTVAGVIEVILVAAALFLLAYPMAC